MQKITRHRSVLVSARLDVCSLRYIPQRGGSGGVMGSGVVPIESQPMVSQYLSIESKRLPICNGSAAINMFMLAVWGTSPKMRIRVG